MSAAPRKAAGAIKLYLVEIKRIEKLSLPILPPPHHALLPLMPSPPTESRIVSRLNESFATQSPRKRAFISATVTSVLCLP